MRDRRAPERIFQRRYNLVVASSSLQYSQQWRTTLAAPARATSDYLYIT